MTPADVQATFCATLVDEWVRRGVTHAVVAPGSRSTPMALALAGRSELRVDVVHDERSAAFVALGSGLGGVPAVLLCTSGTAAANFHPAVVEAGLSGVPMIILTADRPPELRDVGAAQTIDQTRLFGRSVRWFHDPGVADAAASGSWRSMARRAFGAAHDGPVHLNLSFREPLLGTPGTLPDSPAGADLAGWSQRHAALVSPRPDDQLLAALATERGVILAGGRSGVAPTAVSALSQATGWPVLADPLSGCRRLDGAISAFDAVLRVDEFATTVKPDVIVRIGRPAASKVLGEWVRTSAATLIQVGGPGVIDPDHHVAVALSASDLAAIAAALDAPAATPWAAAWVRANEQAEQAITSVLAAETALSEPAVARTIATELPQAASLVVSSSMPVRDLEWFGGPLARAHSNRGANGIDGVLSTALGIAVGGTPTVALVGDIAFLHDAGALTALHQRDADLRIVVVDNGGGGIFSFLPQAGALAPERFEQLFGTPHGTDVEAVARAHRLDTVTVTTADQLAERVRRRGPSVTRVSSDRPRNVAVHGALHDAVATALGGG